MQSKPLIEECVEAMAISRVTYPGCAVSAPLIDWFELDAQDAVDFLVLKKPEWHSYSDIRGMEFEAYISKLLTDPFKSALRVMIKRGLINEQGLEIIKREME